MKNLLTCEHATNFIPVAYKYLFAKEPEVLDTHEGFDPGSFDTFNYLKPLADFSLHQSIGRLLIETNRSVGHKSLFSRFSQEVTLKGKRLLLDTYYFPFRNQIEYKILDYVKENEEVIHFSIHSFTPQLKGEIRNCDIGLLYDPARAIEKEISKKLKRVLTKELPGFNIRYNYPYLGKADGFTTYLRGKFKNGYAGIEIEINQKWVDNNLMPDEIKQGLYNAINSIKKEKP